MGQDFACWGQPDPAQTLCQCRQDILSDGSGVRLALPEPPPDSHEADQAGA
jgi:hypothetical protein